MSGRRSFSPDQAVVEMLEPALGRHAGLAICEGCLLVCRIGSRPSMSCPRCAAVVYVRAPRSLEKTSAYLAAAAILYIPANVLPVMHSSSLLVSQDDTILSGVVYLVRSGSWPLGLLVFFASVTVPLLKILALGLLVWTSARRSRAHMLARARLYRVVELIGRWSMLDIFAVTLLVALVRMGRVASVLPGPGALAFATVVVLTLLAAHSFDPRLIWDPADAND
jgi:paraquat-inducible protein A